jgi:hypothetical protein
MTTQATSQVRRQGEQGENSPRGLRTLVGMTALTAVVVGGLAVGLARQGDEASTGTNTAPAITTGVTARPIESVPVTDQEMYLQWQQRTAAVPEPESPLNAPVLRGGIETLPMP